MTLQARALWRGNAHTSLSLTVPLTWSTLQVSDGGSGLGGGGDGGSEGGGLGGGLGGGGEGGGGDLRTSREIK